MLRAAAAGRREGGGGNVDLASGTGRRRAAVDRVRRWAARAARATHRPSASRSSRSSRSCGVSAWGGAPCAAAPSPRSHMAAAAAHAFSASPSSPIRDGGDCSGTCGGHHARQAPTAPTTASRAHLRRPCLPPPTLYLEPLHCTSGGQVAPAAAYTWTSCAAPLAGAGGREWGGTQPSPSKLGAKYARRPSATGCGRRRRRRVCAVAPPPPRAPARARSPLQAFTEADWNVHVTWRRYLPELPVITVVLLTLSPLWLWRCALFCARAHAARAGTGRPPAHPNPPASHCTAACWSARWWACTRRMPSPTAGRWSARTQSFWRPSR